MKNNEIIAKVERAIADLKQGKLIIVADSEKREAEGDMLGLADFVTPENVNFMITHARGLLCVPMRSEERRVGKECRLRRAAETLVKKNRRENVREVERIEGQR